MGLQTHEVRCGSEQFREKQSAHSFATNSRGLEWQRTVSGKNNRHIVFANKPIIVWDKETNHLIVIVQTDTYQKQANHLIVLADGRLSKAN
jgi:hypothetical protein